MSSKLDARPGSGAGSTAASIAIDQAKFPSLPTQIALVLIDFQNDFVTKEGAVPVTSADDALIQRAAKLAAGFRDIGIVIWVQSQFERPRRFIERQDIITSASQPPTPGARRDESLSPEAFLSSKKPTCVVRGTPGWQLATPLKKNVDPTRDVLIMKTHYSAFQGTKLIQMLRSRLVTSLYICGSLINAGVHATAVDAAAHGYSITLVRDCCGWSDQARADATVANLTEVSGCTVVRARTVVPAAGTDEPAAGGKGEVTQLPAEEILAEEMPADDPIEAADGAEQLDPDGLDVLRELKQKYARVRVPAPRTRSTRSADRDSGKTGEKVREARAPSRPRTARRTREQNSAEKTGELEEGMNKLSLSSGSRKTREQKSTEKTGELDEGMDKLSLSSGSRKAREQKPAEKTGELEEGMDKLSLSSGSRRSAPRGDRPVADPKAQPGRGGVTASPAAGTNTSAQGAKAVDAGEGSGTRSKAHEDHVAKVKRAPSRRSDPKAPSDKVSKPKETREAAPTTKDMDAQTPAAPPAASVEAKPGDAPPNPKESEPLCEGDTGVLYDVLPPALEADVFAKLKDEVDWQRMSHLGGEVPRLVAVQGTMGPDGAHPVYRHPADESPPLRPFSSTVDALRRVVEKLLGHKLNHVLIQFYRDGKDYISEHSDKTLDIVPGSYIANLSLGAERTMVFRTKRPEKEPPYAKSSPPVTDATAAEDKKDETGTKRETQRARLPHNSLLRMGLETNATWLHSIRQDKRMEAEKTPAELSFGGARISLTFRQIGTFLDNKEEFIWGQGARGKGVEEKREVVNGDEEEGERMVRAFGVENRMGKGFEWGRWYGEGFDVLHMRR